MYEDPIYDASLLLYSIPIHHDWTVELDFLNNNTNRLCYFVPLQLFHRIQMLTISRYDNDHFVRAISLLLLIPIHISESYPVLLPGIVDVNTLHRLNHQNEHRSLYNSIQLD